MLLFRFTYLLILLPSQLSGDITNKYSREDLNILREEVRDMFNHAYNGYLEHAYPYDELRPLTCDGIDTWGSYSLTLIDALDTLVVMGNYSEFQRVINIIQENVNFDINMNVSVFETNIRIVGGLLSAHILSHKAGVHLEEGWPCSGPLLRLAEDVASRLLPAFNTSTQMPYGTVNLKTGVPKGETTITCVASIGTFILEFGTLSRLTGNPVYENVAMNALRSLYMFRSRIGLMGNHIDVMTGAWTSQDSGIGAGVDSYFEYLVKGSILFNKPELMLMFKQLKKPIDKYLNKKKWYYWVSMYRGIVTLPVFQSLEAYWPGVLCQIGKIEESMLLIRSYHSVWKKYGFTPEFYNILQNRASTNRESYPLRPELIESAVHLYKATGDPYLLDIGVDILRSIQHSSITSCGYATVKSCHDHSLENRMESFFLAETTKYLYLLFDPDNFINNNGNHGVVHKVNGNTCIIEAGSYVFNTEAHPVDPGILDCCIKKKEYKFKKTAKNRKNQDLPNIQNLKDLSKSSEISEDVLKITEEFVEQFKIVLNNIKETEQSFENEIPENDYEFDNYETQKCKKDRTVEIFLSKCVDYCESSFSNFYKYKTRSIYNKEYSKHGGDKTENIFSDAFFELRERHNNAGFQYLYCSPLKFRSKYFLSEPCF